MTLGERIKEKREERGLSQTQLAEMVGVKTANAISNWEKDKTEPGVEKLVALSQALDVSIEDLLAVPNASDDSSKEAYSDEEKKMISDYRKLDSIGRNVVTGNLKMQVQRCSQTTSESILPCEDNKEKEKPFLSPKDPEYKVNREKIAELKSLKKKSFIDSGLLTEFLWQEGYNKKISIADIVLLFSGWKVPSDQLMNDITQILQKRIDNQNARKV